VYFDRASGGVMTGEAPRIHRLQLMLAGPCLTDNADAREELKRAIRELGMTVSGEGAASLSARITDADFQKLFPAVSCTADSLPVPDRLKPHVSSICEAPRHISFE
jgi:hypothetical protein